MNHHSTIYINGQWRNTDYSKVPSYNPATKEAIGYFSDASIELTEEAIQAAYQSFKSWRNTSLPKRAEYVRQIGNLLEDNKEILAKQITIEMGKPLIESIAEVEASIRSAEYFSSEGRKAIGEILPSSFTNREIKVVRSAVGVVGCITPWNYPISLAAHKIFSALMAGNTIVWKPSPEVVLTTKLFVEIITKNALPAGVINLISSKSDSVGKYITEHPLVPLITFTGSTKVGIEIAKTAAEKLKRVSLELGGNNAAIVLPDANLDLAVNQIALSSFGTSGQRCTATNRIIVHKQIKDEFVNKFILRVSKLNVGDGLLKDTDVGPVINERSIENIVKMVNNAISEGAKLLLGGNRAENLPGHFYMPTILDEVLPTFEIAQNEIFGPVVSIIEVDNFDEAIRINNDTHYGLSTSVFTQNLSIAMRAHQEIESGLVYINAGTANAETGVPFGGFKLSGNGHREVSHHMIDFMTELQSVYINF